MEVVGQGDKVALAACVVAWLEGVVTLNTDERMGTLLNMSCNKAGGEMELWMVRAPLERSRDGKVDSGTLLMHVFLFSLPLKNDVF